MIFVHGELVAQRHQFPLGDVEVVTAAIDLDKVEARRTKQHPIVNFFGLNTYSRIKAELDMYNKKLITGHNDPIAPQIYGKEEEMAFSAYWLWDYLRRSKSAGFLAPLSGGVDSCSTATIVLDSAVS
jgi:NAD+ synthase (glutamine-hydrolysing)